MSERLRNILSRLSDTNHYVRVPDVTVFDEHTEEYFEDASGKPCREGAPGAKKKVRDFDQGKLSEIARRCNERDKTGSLAPLTFGHTIAGEDDESKQPEPIGYATRYSVEHDADLDRAVIKADFFIKKEKYQKASTFPRVSIELWPKQGVIDPIALLRRTPQRDLGQWLYGGESIGPVLRYQRENPMASSKRYGAMEDDLFDDGPGEAPESPDGADGGMSDEEHDQYMRHVHGHPLAKKYNAHCATKYGMPPPEEAPPEPGNDPTDLPSADEPAAPPPPGAPPLRNGMPSATNAFPLKKSRSATQDQDAIKFARLEREVASLRKERDDARGRENMASARALVTQLLAEDFVLDAEKEVQRFARLDDVQRNERADWIREYGRRAPVGGDSSLGPIAKRGSANARTPDLDDPESLPLEDVEKILRYQRQHGEYDMEIHELAPLAMPEKYGQSSRNGKAGG